MLSLNPMIALPALDQVMDDAPRIVARDATAIAAITLMNQPRGRHAPGSSYILVVEDARPIGILTASDVVRLTAAGIDLAMVMVTAVMTQPVITLNRTEAQDALTVLMCLQQHRLHYLPLVDDQGQLVGMVTLADLLQGVSPMAGAAAADLPAPPVLSPAPSPSLQNVLSADSPWLALELLSEQRHATLAQAVPVGIFRTDTVGHCLYVNDRWCQMTGLTLTEAQADGWAQTLHPDDRDRVFAEWYDCAQQNLPFQSEYRFQKRNGDITWVVGQAVAERDRAGALLGYVGSITDISDRKQMEEALLESEHRLQAMLDNSTAVIYMKDPQGRYMMMNHRYEALFHLDRNVVKGKTDYDIFPKAIADAFRANDCEVMAAGVALEKEEIAPQDDGLHTYLSIKFPLFDAAGTLYAVCGMSTDISDRQRKAAMLRNLSLGVATKTDTFLFQALAEYLTKTLGVDYALISELMSPTRARTLAGYGDGQVLATTEYALADTPSAQVVGQGLCIYPSQVQQRFPSDAWLQAIQAESFMGVPLFDSAGQVLGLITVLSRQPLPTDPFLAEILNIFAVRAAAEIERQQAETALRNQQQELARSNAELQQFAYVASHDLQEPLRMIISYLELLERRYKGQLDAKADRFIGFAVDGATRMQTLINDLLSYSRVGTQGQAFKTVDCAKILEGVLANLQVAIAQSHAAITHDPLPAVHGDPSQLTQLFQNLIGNAIKFRRAEPPQVHVGVESAPGKWLFSVQDNGIGMETQYFDQIFIIFQRLHSRSEYSGTGIGLAVCKKIVERHGGTLWVESQLGHGSTFYFSLPDHTHHSL